MKIKPGYIKTKIRFCTTPPFIGLGALGMWYAHALESELKKWEFDSRTALLGDAADKLALCTRHDGYSLRRIRTDGKLLQVYDLKTDQIVSGSILPIAVLGDYIEILEVAQVVDRLKSLGGFRCEFVVDGFTHIGYVLTGKHYSAAWTDKGRALHFEEKTAKNPNAHVVRRLDPVA